MLSAKAMLSLPRFVAALTLVVQAALGSSHLNLEVCHGEIRLSDGGGIHRCAPTHCDAPGDDQPASKTAAESNDCSGCYDFELAASEEPLAMPGSAELPERPVPVAIVEHECPPGPQARRKATCVARGPPRALRHSGLLPGVFPLRI